MKALFRRVALVGVGLIGGSLGMALRSGHLAVSVVGVGRDRERLEKAQSLGAIDDIAGDLAPGVADADLVVLATPVRQILADVERLGPHLARGAIVTDVGSTKTEIARRADATLAPGVFVAGHPMAGSERSGVEAANPDLFRQAVWALTPTAATNADALDRVETMAKAVGARVLVLDPDAHDRAVAVTSHLPHVLAYALSSLAGREAERTAHLYDLAAGSFASATRVAQSPPELWRDVALTNRTALAQSVRSFCAELEAVVSALEAGDDDVVLARFRDGHDAKQRASA